MPETITVEALITRLGCNNPDKKKNVLSEVLLGDEGWYQGIHFSGDETDKIKKTIKEYGWVASSRSSETGKVVWLYAQKD